MYRPALIVALIVCTGLLAGASSVQQLSVTELINGSDLIFEGHVVELRTVGDGTSQIFTRVTFEVQDLIKGQSPGSRIELDFLGGTIGGLTLTISDMRLPKLGETGIYFVESPKRRQVHPLYGWDQGHFLVTTDPSGVETITTFDRRPVGAVLPDAPADDASQMNPTVVRGVSVAEPSSRSRGLTVEGFKQRIKQLAGLR
ncbi:MAG: hypothetical protein DMG13_02720 [Acidobacteria bacterium]|nr:MAG: hypothetical protein DMG13_02720 [Acidobacteriota bacterium]